MCRIEFAEYRAVQPFIRADGAEFRAIKHSPFLLGHLDPPHAANAHVTLPTGPAIGGAWQPRWVAGSVLPCRLDPGRDTV